MGEVGGFAENFPAEASGGEGVLKGGVLSRLAKTGESRRGLLFVPVKATHLQDYSLRRFWGQQLNRGAGISATKKKKGMRLETKIELLLKIFLSPVVFFKYLVADNFKIKFALLDTVAFLARQIGKLKL